MEGNQSKKPNNEDRRKQYATLGVVLEKYFQRWRLVFPTHPVTKGQMAVYLEALEDLTPGQLEDACKEVIKTAVAFPKPAEIRKVATLQHEAEAGQFLGPRMIDYPAVGQDEREAALEFSAALKKQLGIKR